MSDGNTNCNPADGCDVCGRNTVDCYIADFLHTPDEHTATHYPDGVLHTFTGPNSDGHTRTWRVATRHPENTTHTPR